MLESTVIIDRLRRRSTQTPCLIKGLDPSCWSWRGYTNQEGYGVLYVPESRRTHRLAYEALVCQIPKDLVLDHLCRNTRCWNPSHLEPVTNRVNVVLRSNSPSSISARKTHCINGHLFDDKNSYHPPGRDRERQCRACRRDRERQRRAGALLAAQEWA